MDGVIDRNSEADTEGEDAADLKRLVERVEKTGVKEQGEGIGNDT